MSFGSNRCEFKITFWGFGVAFGKEEKPLIGISHFGGFVSYSKATHYTCLCFCLNQNSIVELFDQC